MSWSKDFKPTKLNREPKGLAPEARAQEKRSPTSFSLRLQSLSLYFKGLRRKRQPGTSLVVLSISADLALFESSKAAVPSARGAERHAARCCRNLSLLASMFSTASVPPAPPVPDSPPQLK